GQRTYNAPP
nr:immunoglobulin light chain junction region [Homo sapiens]MCD02620.1 immunoglobulin light chain junction region [Homo sapiens]